MAVGDTVIERTPLIRIYGSRHPLNPVVLARAIQTGDDRKNLSDMLPAQRRASLQNWESRLHDTVGRTFLDKQEKEEASVADRQGLGITEEQPSGS